MSQKDIAIGNKKPIPKTKRYDIPAIQQAKAIIENDPAADLDNESLAERVRINAFKLKVGFRELFDDTPHQYRIRLRLTMAKELLESTDDTIEQIAILVGFDSRNGFSVAFKKMLGISPRDYRKQR